MQAQADNPEQQPVLRLNGLTKSFGKTVAVDRLDLTVRAGEVLALLGPNGAGKTTTIRCVTGLARPDTGTIMIDGIDMLEDPIGAKSRLGFVPDRAWFYPKVTARELLRFIAGVRKLPDPEPQIRLLLERFDLTRHADRLTESYSHGMRQRLAFCTALLGEPLLFISDEPMVGLDVHGHREVKLLFRELARAGRSVILTTHTLSVAEEIADRIALIDQGRLIAHGTVQELRDLTSRQDANLEELFLILTRTESPA